MITLGNFKTTALLALAAATLAAPSAKAALTYSTDDLFIGFRQAGNNTTEYVVNIGQAAQFRDSTSQFALSLPGLSSDLTNAFGSLTGVTWGLIGTTQNTRGTGVDNLVRLIYISEPIGTLPTASSNQSGPANSIIGFQNYWTGGTAANVPQSATLSPGDANSWTSKVTTSFGASGVLNTIESSLSNTLDFYRLPQTANGSMSNEGQFSFSSGVVTFTSSDFTAVPEPTAAVVGLALLGVTILHRRRTTATA